MEQVTVAVTFYIYIMEVFGSNLIRKFGYPDWGFSWFSSTSPEKCRDISLLGPDHSLPNAFQVIHHSELHSLYIEMVVWYTTEENGEHARYDWRCEDGLRTPAGGHRAVCIPARRRGPIESSRPYVAKGAWSPTSVGQGAPNKLSMSVIIILLLFLVGWCWVHLVRRPLQGYCTSTGWWMLVTGAIGWIKIGRGNRSTRKEPAPGPLCPPHISHDQTRARTRAAAVGTQRLTAASVRLLVEGDGRS
jgi:hypothetical protein